MTVERPVEIAVYVAKRSRGRGDQRRAVIAAALGIRADDVEFRVGERGRPDLAGVGGEPGADGLVADVNLAHSGDLLLIAVVRGARVGVDVEKCRSRRFDALARRVFSPVEHDAWSQATDRERTFFTMWTRKEALTKATGRGLERLREITATPCPPGWSIIDLRVGDGYVAAVASPVTSVRVTLRQWPQVASTS